MPPTLTQFRIEDLDMNQHTPGIGHNGSPDPIETVMGQYDDIITEAQNWTDGETVTTEAQMKAVDELLKSFKTYKSKLADAAKERTDPLHKAWKAEVAAVKVYTDDADRIQAALVAAVAPFKAKLAAEKEAERKAAWEAAQAAQREAEAKAAAARASDIEAQREAAAAQQAAMDAKKAASAAQKDTVKGMRTVWHYEITDHRALLHWIAANDRAAVTKFIEDYAQAHHKQGKMDGVRTWSTKEAY
jgi:hypothetical protein